MTEAVLSPMTSTPALAHKALRGAAMTWFAVAAVGHFLFALYIVGHFGARIFTGGLEALGETDLTGGFVPGELLGNLAVAAHVLLAVIVIGGGPLQLMPGIRRRFPAFHRWLGRTYMVAAVVAALAGFYMIWTRGTVGGIVNNVGVSLDAVLIVVFAAIALRHAMARNIAAHRRWALRLFMVASAVWFFRIGFMAWMMLTGGAGIDMATFTGPFPYVMSFAQYLLPLAVLELYFRAQDSSSGPAKAAVAATIFAFTALTALGVFGATTGMWLPHLTPA